MCASFLVCLLYCCPILCHYAGPVFQHLLCQDYSISIHCTHPKVCVTNLSLNDSIELLPRRAGHCTFLNDKSVHVIMCMCVRAFVCVCECVCVCVCV